MSEVYQLPNWELAGWQAYFGMQDKPPPPASNESVAKKLDLFFGVAKQRKAEKERRRIVSDSWGD